MRNVPVTLSTVIKEMSVRFNCSMYIAKYIVVFIIALVFEYLVNLFVQGLLNT